MPSSHATQPRPLAGWPDNRACPPNAARIGSSSRLAIRNPSSRWCPATDSIASSCRTPQFFDIEPIATAVRPPVQPPPSSPGTYLRYSANSTLEPRCGLACRPETFPCIGRRATNGSAPSRVTAGSRKLRARSIGKHALPFPKLPCPPRCPRTHEPRNVGTRQARPIRAARTRTYRTSAIISGHQPANDLFRVNPFSLSGERGNDPVRQDGGTAASWMSSRRTM